MHFQGLLIGLSCFLVIAIFHPIVIKGEFYFGVKIWWIFLLLGFVAVIASLFMTSITLASILGIFGFTCFWSIGELFQQKKRVLKGWFPPGPSHKK